MEYYDVIDGPSASILGHFQTEEEALALVRDLIEANDPSWAEDLAVGGVRRDGSFGEPLSGAALLARLEDAAAPAR